MDQLAAMRAFVRIVDTGSFTRAAQALGMPKANDDQAGAIARGASAHHAAEPYHAAGDRHHRRPRPITSGRSVCWPISDELDASMIPAQAHPRGRLRIERARVARPAGDPAALADFLAAYPDIELEMGLSDRPADLVAENVDCVIRGGVIADQSADRPAHSPRCA